MKLIVDERNTLDQRVLVLPFDMSSSNCLARLIRMGVKVKHVP